MSSSLAQTDNSFLEKKPDFTFVKSKIIINFSRWVKMCCLPNWAPKLTDILLKQYQISLECLDFLVEVSVQFSRSLVSDSLWLHESQHARPPCPSPTPGVHSDSHPSSWWCHPTILSSVVPFSSAFSQDSHRQIFSSVISVHSLSKSSYHI